MHLLPRDSSIGTARIQECEPCKSRRRRHLDQTECNCLALRQAARHVSQIYDGHLAAEGLKTTQYSILAKLNRLGPLSINELAKSMVMDRTTLGPRRPPA